MDKFSVGDLVEFNNMDSWVSPNFYFASKLGTIGEVTRVSQNDVTFLAPSGLNHTVFAWNLRLLYAV